MSSNVIQKYHECGLFDYKVRSVEDIKTIYGYGLEDIKGYDELTEDNQELFSKFLIRFVNAHGLDKRIQLKPTKVNYVMEVYYIDTYKGVEEVLAIEYRRRTSKGRYAKFLMHKFHNVTDEELYKCKQQTNYFLRIDYKCPRKDWLHILNPEQWY